MCLYVSLFVICGLETSRLWSGLRKTHLTFPHKKVQCSEKCALLCLSFIGTFSSLKNNKQKTSCMCMCLCVSVDALVPWRSEDNSGAGLHMFEKEPLLVCHCVCQATWLGQPVSSSAAPPLKFPQYPKIVPPAGDRMLKCMSLQDNSHSNHAAS